MKELGLYIHIPYCKSKCFYCDFLSFDNADDKIDEYFQALMIEMDLLQQIKNDYTVKTIFIGGGTPTYVHVDYITLIINKIKNSIIIDKNVEITIEGNPGTFNKKDLLKLKNVGINRLSIGLQSWQDEILKSIGRIHTSREFVEGYNAALDIGFNNINIDLIFGLPSQSMEQWIETLNKVIDLKPTHLSCYSLKVEEGTKLCQMIEKDKIILDEELDRDMYHYTQNLLMEKGYIHYEISNFSKDKFECKHNLVYWELKEYIGLGLGAHSFFNGYRYSNEKKLETYIDKLLSGNNIIEDKSVVNKNRYKEEYLFLGLRKIKGINKKDYNTIFKIPIEVDYRKNLDKLLSRGLIEETNENIKLTKKGLDLANQVFISFIE